MGVKQSLVPFFGTKVKSTNYWHICQAHYLGFFVMALSVEIQENIDRGERLRTIRGMLGLTALEFSKLCGVADSTLKKWEKGKARGLTSKGAHKIISALPQTNVICNSEWLLEGIGEPPKLINTYASNADQKSSGKETLNASPDSSIALEINYFRQHNDKTVVIQVIDDGMLPIFKPNDYVAGIKVTGKAMALLSGKICIIETELHGKIVRKLRFEPTNNTYTLLTMHPNTSVEEPIIMNAKLTFAAPVLRRWIFSGNNK